jgi:S1-C subfamily serine protease
MHASQLRISLIAAILGGALVAAVMVLLDVGKTTKTTTVVRQSPLGARPASNNLGSAALTPREIYKRDAPGVVNVRAQIVQRVSSPFDFGPQEQRGQATGSGFVVNGSGDILTNAHVIEGASRVTVQFENDKTADAKVVGKDTTIAIGNPFGLDRTLTTGVVSALQRRIEAPNGFSIDHVIQTDAAINPGNSGGPLLDAAGRVIGINSQIATGGSGNGNVGIGFAVPINTAKRVIPQLEKSGTVQRAYLGITGLTIDRSLDRLNLNSSDGVLVQSVQPGSPAAKAGLKGGQTQANLDGSDIALGGDIIKKIDGRNVKSMDDVSSTVDAKKPGDSVTLEVLRGGQTKTLTIKLGQRPSQAPQQ